VWKTKNGCRNVKFSGWNFEGSGDGNFQIFPVDISTGFNVSGKKK
jgi:hypothetical protein